MSDEQLRAIRARVEEFDTKTRSFQSEGELEVRLISKNDHERYVIGRPFTTSIDSDGFTYLLINDNVRWRGCAAMNNFIVHAPEDMRALLDALDTAQHEITHLRDALARIAEVAGASECGVCQATASEAHTARGG